MKASTSRFNRIALIAWGIAGLSTFQCAHAKDVTMAFGLALPPYVISESSSGFELEVIKEALALKGHNLKPMFVPLARVPEMLRSRQVDSAERGTPELTEDRGFFYGLESAVTYQDYAISLKKNNLSIQSYADLKDKSVIGFQGATTFLGSEYAGAVAGNAKYSETADQKRQPMMLFSGRTQVIVGDHNIFKYFSQAVAGEVDVKQDVTFHKIFPPSSATHNHQVFLDKQIRDDFNAGLKQLKSSGRYNDIVKRYIKG